MSFTPRHPTEIRLAVESAFDDSNLIDYSCAEIERLERELAEKVSAISDVTKQRDDLFLVKNRLVNALWRIAITDDADCVLADDPKAMTAIAREALK